jgi:hypothetical protein
MANGRAFTQWSPDTCGCVIQYFNDDLTHCATVQACPKHQNFSGQAHLDAVTAHNRKRNNVHAWMKQQASRWGITLLKHQRGYDVLPFLLNYDFSSTSPDVDPVIAKALAALSASKKQQIQSDLNAQFGVGVVVLP